MTAEHRIVGTVRGGVIVPNVNAFLSEGIQVEIVLPSVSAPPECSAESAIWQQARQESETIQTKWEREPRDKNGWPLSFIEDTYGCFADDPIERLPQEPMCAELLAELHQWQALSVQAWAMFPYDETEL